MSLDKRIEEKRNRRDRAEKNFNQKDSKVEDLKEALTAARETRAEIDKHAKKLGEKIWAEEQADSSDTGDRSDEWMLRATNRIDVLADEHEKSTALIERVLEKITRNKDLRSDFAKDLKALEKDLERLRKLAEEKKDRAGMVSEHFHIAEFHCRNGVPVPTASEPAVKFVCVNYLEKARAQYGTISVNSGFRTREYNASIGGASLSFHIYNEHPGCAAVDHTAAGASPGTLQRWYDSGPNPAGMGYYSAFTHVDNRSYRSRWSGS